MPSSTGSNPGSTSRPVWAEVVLGLRWPLALVGLALVAFLVWRETLHQATDTAEAAGRGVIEAVQEVTDGFLTGDVTETFLSSMPESSSAGSGRLEVATLEMVESFERSEERRVLWDMVSLGTTVSEVRVPVTYRYHVRLEDAWEVVVDGPICFVRAPALRPSLPPAIHTDRLETRSEAAWLHLDAEEQLDALVRGVTPRLETRASSPQHMQLVRENARRTVREFVRGWLLREESWGGEGVRAIEVVFADEDSGVVAPAELGAPLRVPSEGS